MFGKNTSMHADAISNFSCKKEHVELLRCMDFTFPVKESTVDLFGETPACMCGLAEINMCTV